MSTTWFGLTDEESCNRPSSSAVVPLIDGKCVWNVSPGEIHEVLEYKEKFLDAEMQTAKKDSNQDFFDNTVMPEFCSLNDNLISGGEETDLCKIWVKDNPESSDIVKANFCGEYSNWKDLPTECKCQRADLNPDVIMLRNMQVYTEEPGCAIRFCMMEDMDKYLIPSKFWPENNNCDGTFCHNIISYGAVDLMEDVDQSLNCGSGGPSGEEKEEKEECILGDGDGGGGSYFSTLDLFVMMLDPQAFILVVALILILVPVIGVLFVGRAGLLKPPFLVVYGLTFMFIIALSVAFYRYSVLTSGN